MLECFISVYLFIAILFTSNETVNLSVSPHRYNCLVLRTEMEKNSEIANPKYIVKMQLLTQF